MSNTTLRTTAIETMGELADYLASVGVPTERDDGYLTTPNGTRIYWDIQDPGNVSIGWAYRDRGSEGESGPLEALTPADLI